MRLTLNRRFILISLVFLICSFFCISTISSHLLQQRCVEQKASAFYKEGIHMSEKYVGNYFDTTDNQSMGNTIRAHLESLSVYLNADIWLVNKDGELILTSDSDTDILEHRTIEGFSSVLPKGRYYTIGDFYGTLSEESLSVMVPVSHDYHVRGYIVLHTPMSIIVQEKEGYLLPFYITMLLLMGLVFLFWFINWYTVYRPVRRLCISAKAYAAGESDQSIVIPRDDELGDLSRTMEFMVTSLRDSDARQKKMISNISHDFRSPLTSIKGYIEAMLDGTIPFEMQEKYLNIVLRETERLTKLTSGLLELNSMDSRQKNLTLTEFDINTVIKNTAASFEGTCTAKRISFNLLFSDWSSLVYADMERIQQVLYNLIDNAIKFSRENSVITIETMEKGDKVFVSIRDTGIGIPKESLNKIWDRFYKTDQSRGKDKKGTGLGLSIVKEIIQLHNENINVISTEGVGTEFIFSLSRKPTENTAS